MKKIICGVLVVVLTTAIFFGVADYLSFRKVRVRIDYDDPWDWGNGYVLYHAVYRTPEGLKDDWRTLQEWETMKFLNSKLGK